MTEPVVELFINGAWVDAVTNGNGVLVRDQVRVKAGRSNWTARTDSGSARFALANYDGRWSPDYSAGAYFGDFRRNIPTRVGMKDVGTYLMSGLGSADVASTPDIAGTGGGSPTTPTVVGTPTTTVVSSFSTTHTYNMPATVNVGERLLISACLGHSSAAASGGTLDDWTLVHSDTRHTFDAWRIYEIDVNSSALATALAGSTVTFSTSTGVKSSAVVTRTAGARSGGQGAAWDFVAGTYGTNQATISDPPNLATTWGADANLYYSMFAADKGGSALDLTTQPSGYTAQADTGGTADHGFITGIASKASSAGSDDPGVWTVDATAFMASGTFAYRPLEDPSSDGVLDIAGDIDLRISFQQIQDLVDIDQGGSRVRLGHKNSGADGWEWDLYLALGEVVSAFVWYDSTGALKFATSESSGAPLGHSFQHEAKALRVTLDVDDGSSGHVVTFWEADSLAGPWTVIGIPIIGTGTTSIKTNDAPIRVGGNPLDLGHVPLPGKLLGFEMYDGIDGTRVVGADFTAQTVGATGFTDDESRVWTIGAGGEITDVRWRMHGELASIPTRWNTDGSDVWAPVEATGLLRRLRQGPRKLESAIRRATIRSATSVVQYWPCEEQGGGYITRFGAAVGTNPIVVTNGVPNTGANDVFLASESLATFGDSLWTATVDPYTGTGSWQLRWLQYIPAGFVADPAGIDFIIINTTDLQWIVQYRNDNGGQFRLLAFRAAVLEYSSAWASFFADEKPFRMHLAIEQNGTSIDVALDAQEPGQPFGGGISTTSAVVGSVGEVTSIILNPGLTIGEWAAGHLTLQSVVTPTSELAVELDAYDAEPAGERIIRLCTEEGIGYRIRGAPAQSELMGPQRPGTLIDLLQECADTDLGLLFEPREAVAVGYRTYAHMSNQAPQVALDYSVGEVAAPLELDRDDQEFANDIEVRNWNGTTARAVLEDGSALSVSQPPVGAGRYDASYPVNAQDNQLPVLADRRLVLSSPNEPRVSKLKLALHHGAIVADPVLTQAILDLELGDLVTVDNNLTVALGSTQVRQILQGYAEVLSTHEHYIDCLTTPGSPWEQTPAAVTDLMGQAGVSQALLTWSEPFNDGSPITGYDIERSGQSATAGFAALATISPAGSYVDSTPTAGTQYWYRVRATNSAGDAPWSNVVAVTSLVAGDPPAAISNLTATAGAAGEIDLAWSAPASTETITSYDIQRSTTSATGPWSDVEIDLAPATTYNDTGLVASTEHWYRVRATSSEGDGPWSNIDSATTIAGSTFPTPVSVTESSDSSFVTTHPVLMPPSLAAGEGVVVFASLGQAVTGFADFTTEGFTALTSATNSGTHLHAYLINDLSAGEATSIAGSTLNLTTSTTTKGSFQAYRIQDWESGGDGVAWEWGTAATGFGTTPNPPSVTAGWGSALNLWLAVEAAGGTGATVTTNPTNYTAGADGDAAAGYTLGSAHRQLETATEDPGTFTIDDGGPGENWVANTLALLGSASGGGGGQPGTPAPTIPTFNSGSATTITAGQNVKTIIEAGAQGDHFLLAAGTHTNCENVRLKTNMHVRLATGCILDGTGKGYCFRPEAQSTTGVAIGGDPAGARPVIRDYGNGTSNQAYGAIMGRADDALAGQFLYQDTDDWFIYHLDLDGNASNGIKMGSNWTIYDVEVHGHTVTGIQADRVVGGLIHSCDFYWNALNPATGASANGANVKVTWINADVGRTSITPIVRTKAPFVVSNCTFEGLDRNGGPGDTNIGMWFDLDCQQCLVEYCSFDDHPTTSIFAEGCNDVEAAYNTIRNSDGYGSALGDDFINGALCVGESTNCNFHHNTLIGCSRAMVNRMSNRSSDWYNSDNASFVNYAWASGPRYWILDTIATPAVSGQSNMWTGANSFTDNILTNCDRVVINEGTNNGGMTTQGSTPATLTFTGNDYSGSGSIAFYDRSNTALTLGQWQALGYDT